MMAKNLYTPDIQAVLERDEGFLVALAFASHYPIEDLRQDVAEAMLAGKNIHRAVPAALGVHRFPDGFWRSMDLHVIARFNEVVEDNIADMPAPKQRRSALVAGLAIDQGIGLRAAQKRVKKMLDQSRRQGDLFAGWEG